eukprot:5154338-Pyramimonas_sp.AAC.1
MCTSTTNPEGKWHPAASNASRTKTTSDASLTTGSPGSLQNCHPSPHLLRLKKSAWSCRTAKTVRVFARGVKIVRLCAEPFRTASKNWMPASDQVTCLRCMACKVPRLEKCRRPAKATASPRRIRAVSAALRSASASNAARWSPCSTSCPYVRPNSLPGSPPAAFLRMRLPPLAILPTTPPIGCSRGSGGSNPSMRCTELITETYCGTC